jgi:uncharacterized protein (DUF1330 family)
MQMSAFMKTMLAVLAGAGIGAVSMQALRAQANPPAYLVTEMTVKNEDGYTRQFLPARAKAIQDVGGKYVVRSGESVPVAGQTPAQRIVIIQFDDMDKLSAFVNSNAFKDSEDIGERYADIRVYGVQGVSR